MGHRPRAARPPRGKADRHQGDDGLSEGLTYPGGAEALIAHWQQRRAPLDQAPGESLPLAADLAALAHQPVLPEPSRPASGQSRKLQELRAELAGQSELALLNALCIAHLRKRGFPPEAPPLFRRIWTEQGEALLKSLDSRWLISSIITFADHGETEAQRRLGASMQVLFSLMKLYEAERLHSGHAPQQPFRLNRRAAAPLPLGMTGFSIASGGLDVNLLAPIWDEALRTPVAGPLACHLLERMNADPGTVFRRLAMMREALKARKAAGTAAAGLQSAGKAQQP
ncbi:hypothetical protein [Cereibacter changlensis]|uniref:hypothetical protein n=1 Tax=Cereibacter changlensis TaxID=402884 RepID=UPI004033BF85